METVSDYRRKRKRATANARYHARREINQCTRCNNYIDDGSSRCVTCREIHNAVKRAIYHTRVNDGMCTRCGLQPVMPGKTKCEEHLKTEAIEHMEMSMLLAKNGLCRRCKQDAEPNLKHCRACLVDSLAKTRARRYNHV